MNCWLSVLVIDIGKKNEKRGVMPPFPVLGMRGQLGDLPALATTFVIVATPIF